MEPPGALDELADVRSRLDRMVEQRLQRPFSAREEDEFLALARREQALLQALAAQDSNAESETSSQLPEL